MPLDKRVICRNILECIKTQEHGFTCLGIRYLRNEEIQIWFHNDLFFMQDSRTQDQPDGHFADTESVFRYIELMFILYPKAKIRVC